jgi:hypothetical protein
MSEVAVTAKDAVWLSGMAETAQRTGSLAAALRSGLPDLDNEALARLTKAEGTAMFVAELMAAREPNAPAPHRPYPSLWVISIGILLCGSLSVIAPSLGLSLALIGAISAGAWLFHGRVIRRIIDRFPEYRLKPTVLYAALVVLGLGFEIRSGTATPDLPSPSGSFSPWLLALPMALGLGGIGVWWMLRRVPVVRRLISRLTWQWRDHIEAYRVARMLEIAVNHVEDDLDLATILQACAEDPVLATLVRRAQSGVADDAKLGKALFASGIFPKEVEPIVLRLDGPDRRTAASELANRLRPVALQQNR